MPNNEPDQWDASDAVTLRTYLADHPKFLRVLTSRMPKIEGKSMEERAMTGSEACGYMLTLQEIQALARDLIQGVDSPGFFNQKE